MLAKRWSEHQDAEAAHRLVTCHLRLVAKIAMGYRGYGLPIGEVISEGNVGLMQAVKKFDPDKGFRLATYAMWWIRASIQEYILRSWSLVKMGTTAAQKKLFFNLRKAKSQIAAFEEGDLHPEQVSTIATKLGVLGRGGHQHEPPPVRRRRLAERADARRTARASGRTGWSTTTPLSQETVLAESEENSRAHGPAAGGHAELTDRERHILTERRLKDDPDHPGRPGRPVRRQPRAGPPDRGPRLREAAEVHARRGAGRAEPGRRLRAGSAGSAKGRRGKPWPPFSRPAPISARPPARTRPPARRS